MHIDNITSENIVLTNDGKTMQISIYEKEIDRLNNIINKSKEIYLKELNKCNKNGTYVSKVAVDMFNVLEGNK